MQLRNLRNDDDAVSPVIGVILMVAITVILAAVIATFVLGLGEQVSDTAPQASFTFDWDENGDTGAADFNQGNGGDGVLTITHAGGATLDVNNIDISGDNSDSGSYSLVDGSDTNKFGSDSELSAGVSFTWDGNYDEKVTLTWQNSQGTDSATLRTYTIPSDN